MTKNTDSANQAAAVGMIPDYHVHTVYCRHAEGEMQAYRGAAVRRMLPELSFSCHAPNTDGYDPRNRMTIAQFSEYREKASALQAETPPPVIRMGIEADYYEAGIPFLKRWLPEQPFDLVLGSVHYIGDWNFDAPESLGQWNHVDVTGAWRAYFGLVGKLADTGLFDVLAHPDLPKKFGHRPPDRKVAEMLKPLLDRVAAAGMAIEINTSGLRKPVREIYPSPLFLALARERDIPVCFGSDAHAPNEVARDFEAALDLAKDIGYSHSRWFEKRRARDIPLPGSCAR